MSSLPVVKRTLPRTAWILLPAGALVLSLFVAILALTGSVSATSASQPLEPSMIVSESDDDGTAEAVEGAESPITLPLVAYEVFLSRDPFEPVVEPDEPMAPVDANGDPVDPVDPDGAPADPSDPNTTDPDQPVSDPDGTETGRCRGDAEVVCDGTVLVLEDLRTVDSDEIAVIVVGDVTYQVRPGERFAESFELLRIDIDSARLLYGDEVFSLRLLSSVMK